MMMKQNQRISGLLVSILLLVAAVTMTACAPASSQTTPSAAASTAAGTSAPDATATGTSTPDATAALRTFTAEELTKYDGKNGNPAYVAVNGTVYDVSSVPEWQGGNHQSRFQAGRDFSEDIKKSPHGLSKLDTVPVVGTYVE